MPASEPHLGYALSSARRDQDFVASGVSVFLHLDFILMPDDVFSLYPIAWAAFEVTPAPLD